MALSLGSGSYPLRWRSPELWRAVCEALPGPAPAGDSTRFSSVSARDVLRAVERAGVDVSGVTVGHALGDLVDVGLVWRRAKGAGWTWLGWEWFSAGGVELGRGRWLLVPWDEWALVACRVGFGSYPWREDSGLGPIEVGWVLDAARYMRSPDEVAAREALERAFADELVEVGEELLGRLALWTCSVVGARLDAA